MTLTMNLRASSDGRLIGPGCANGQQVRYEITGARGEWVVEICYPHSLRRFSWERHSLHAFTTLKAAHAFVKRDFHRRQLLRAVA